MLFTPLELVVLSVGCGIFVMALTNIINFYDGADLNLGTIVFLAGMVFYCFSQKHLHLNIWEL